LKHLEMDVTGIHADYIKWGYCSEYY